MKSLGAITLPSLTRRTIHARHAAAQIRLAQKPDEASRTCALPVVANATVQAIHADALIRDLAQGATVFRLANALTLLAPSVLAGHSFAQIGLFWNVAHHSLKATVALASPVFLAGSIGTLHVLARVWNLAKAATVSSFTNAHSSIALSTILALDVLACICWRLTEFAGERWRTLTLPIDTTALV